MSKLMNHWKQHFHFKILVLSLHIVLCMETTCGRAEYQIGKECCPMCAPGNRVHKHCTEFTSTSCIPCTGSTFLDQPNGRSSCFPCTNCDPVSGLKVKQGCTSISDAVCQPLEGYFCKLPTYQGCAFAQEHSRCKPGQYISQQATSSKDTECSDCTGDTFSNGSLTSCQPHTKCESLDKVQVISGDHSSDTVCETAKSGVGEIIIPIVIIACIAIVGTMAFLVYWKFGRKKTRKLMNTGKNVESTAISLMRPVPETNLNSPGLCLDPPP
ncbi:tumor necrosis factor receptor superfamily member 14-like isoform X1 [Osmerus mordax]|uniref:tumor necrosis factor receptor superfamily member 14-like isoform X1 n=1 Tax=Osmerus mordax TaxID=8014 RepID=UPI0035104359